jgi:hypothetical protein
MKLLVDFNADGEESMRTLQMYFVAAVLTRYSGHRGRAAKRLGVHRNTLYREIEEFNLQPLIDRLRKTRVPQLKLFANALQGVPIRAGYAQDVLVLNINSQGENSAYPQLTNRVEKIKAYQTAS